MIRILALLVLLAAPPGAAAQDDGPSGPLGRWTANDDAQYRRFFRYHGRCESMIAAGRWDDAKAFVKPLIWFLDRLDQRKLADHPKTTYLRSLYRSCQRRIDARSKTDPGASSGVTAYVLEGGRGKGRAPDAPSGSLASTLRKPPPIVRLGPGRLTGNKGRWSASASQLSLLGGHDRTFASRSFHTRTTLLAGSPTSNARRPMVSLTSKVGLQLEGLVFDAGGLNRYGSRGLQVRRSPGAPVCEIRFRGSLSLRYCVFLNGSAGGLRLICEGEGEARIEHCIFVGGVGPALKLEGAGARYHVSRCTFALIHRPARGKPATAVEHVSGRLDLRACLFAGCAPALAIHRGAISGTRLFDNRLVALDGPFVERIDGRRRQGFDARTAEAELDFADAADNLARRLRVRLALDGPSLAAYLAASSALDAAQRRWLTTYAAARAGGRPTPKGVAPRYPANAAWVFPLDDSALDASDDEDALRAGAAPPEDDAEAEGDDDTDED